jgi:Rrf2 family nitric oxide-sensitive transcriptional repressor
MQLTRYTDYSLRVLMYLAARPGRLAHIDEIADAYGVSRGHLMKVVRDLATREFVESSRGRGGGVRLTRPPSEIVLGDVVRATEENLTIVECFGSNNKCVIAPACGLKHTLALALEAFFAVLDDYTLADLTTKRHKLAGLLNIE